MAGEYLDPSRWPEWMNADTLSPAPPDDMNSRLFPASSSRIPRWRVPDQGGVESWSDLTPAHLAYGASMIPGIGGFIGAGLRAAPKSSMAALAAGGLLAGTSSAGQAADQVDPIQAEMDSINARLERNNNDIVRLGTTTTKSPKGTQASAIETLKGTIASDQARLGVLQDQFSTRANEQKAEAERQRAREAPFQERYPVLGQAAPFIGPAVALGTNYGLGRWLGRKQTMGVNAWEKANVDAAKVFTSTAKGQGPDSFRGQALAGELAARQAKGLPMNNPLITGAVAGGAAGALEGGVIPYFTTEYDAQTLPPGSPNQLKAANAVSDPNWWLSKVGLPAGMGALAGAFGGYRGVKAKGPWDDPSPKTAGLLAALEARTNQKTAALPPGGVIATGRQNTFGGAVPPLAFSGQLPRAPKGQPRLVQDASGNWTLAP